MTLSSTDHPLIPRSASPGTRSLHGRKALWGLLASLASKVSLLDSHIMSYAELSSTIHLPVATLRWKRQNPTRHHSMLSFPALFYVKFFCFKEIKPVNPKGNQLWIFTGRTDAESEAPILWPPDAKNWLFGKDPDAGKDWGQEEKGMTQDEMVGWHHPLNGHEFEQTPGDGEGQGRLVCCPWGCKESGITYRLNNNKLHAHMMWPQWDPLSGRAGKNLGSATKRICSPCS